MSEYNGQSRRHLLAISSLVNDVSVNPIQKHCLTSNYHHHHCQQRNTSYTCQLYISPPSNYDYFTQYSPMFTGSSSPVDNDHSRQSSIVEPPDLWNHSTTGMHQALNGNIVISSLSKAKRKRIMTHQYNRLVQVFQITDTPSSEIRRQLAEELDMTKREVQVEHFLNMCMS